MSTWHRSRHLSSPAKPGPPLDRPPLRPRRRARAGAVWLLLVGGLLTLQLLFGPSTSTSKTKNHKLHLHRFRRPGHHRPGEDGHHRPEREGDRRPGQRRQLLHPGPYRHPRRHPGASPGRPQGPGQGGHHQRDDPRGHHPRPAAVRVCSSASSSTWAAGPASSCPAAWAASWASAATRPRSTTSTTGRRPGSPTWPATRGSSRRSPRWSTSSRTPTSTAKRAPWAPRAC